MAKICILWIGLLMFNLAAYGETTLPKSEQVSKEPIGELHIDKTYGFKIRGPKGWFKRIKPPIPGHTSRDSVIYEKNLGEKSVFPQLSITTDTLPEDIKTALDFSKLILQFWKEALLRHKTGTMKVIEEPHEVEINGIRAARVIFEMTDNDGKSMRTLDYKFIKGNVVISVMGLDWSYSHHAHMKDFEEAANSFKFIEK